MPGRGPAPKDPATRRRRNKEQRTTIGNDAGEIRGPELPEAYWVKGSAKSSRSSQLKFKPATREWFGNWRTSPQSTAFTAPTWDVLVYIIAPLFDQFIRTGDPKLAGELRLQLSKLGATPEDLARLKWDLDKPPAENLEGSGSGSRWRGELRVVEQPA